MVGGWFQPELTYEGLGVLTLRGQRRVIRGPARVSIGSNGSTTASMTVSESLLEGDATADQSRTSASDGRRPARAISFDESEDWSGSLHIQTPEGLLSTAMDCYCTGALPVSPSPGQQIQLFLLVTEFRTSCAGNAAYWVAALGNFDASYFNDRRGFAAHPLLLRRPAPIVPEDEEKESFLARVLGPPDNGVIAFEFRDDLGFIDWVASPEDPNQRLKPDEGSFRITAAMVCGVHDEHTAGSGAGDLDWLPFDFTELLALATGAPVRIPWWEFRAGDGQLLRRVHIHSHPKPYVTWQPAIPHRVPGVGTLLTKASRSEYFGRTELRVALRLLLQARSNIGAIDESLRSLFVASETLCNLVLRRVKVYARDVLDETRLKTFKSALEEATQKLKVLREEPLIENEHQWRPSFLEGVMTQLTELPNRPQEPGFAKRMELLLADSELPDAEILDSYCATHREIGEARWSRLLAKYRGNTTHLGYVGIGEKGHDAQGILTVNRHLQDVLLRVILKKLGYDGEYQPAVFTMGAPSRLDWVRKTTPASVLGFR